MKTCNYLKMLLRRAALCVAIVTATACGGGGDDESGNGGGTTPGGGGQPEAPIPTDTLKVLMIGNSFTDNMVEYIDNIASKEGYPMVVANLYRGGCTITRHVSNIGKKIYSYRKRVGGTTLNPTPANSYSLKDGIDDEDWDIVSVQPGLPDAGLDSTFVGLPTLLDYVKQEVDNPDLKIYFVQLWPYEIPVKDSINNIYNKYFKKDQKIMYDSIINTTIRIASKYDMTVIPAGTAVQNIRNIWGNVCCNPADGYHLSEGIGRYIGGCVLYSSVTSRLVSEDGYYPTSKMSKSEAATIRKAVKAAMTSPNQVTNIK